MAEPPAPSISAAAHAYQLAMSQQSISPPAPTVVDGLESAEVAKDTVMKDSIEIPNVRHSHILPHTHIPMRQYLFSCSMLSLQLLDQSAT